MTIALWTRALDRVLVVTSDWGLSINQINSYTIGYHCFINLCGRYYEACGRQVMGSLMDQEKPRLLMLVRLAALGTQNRYILPQVYLIMDYYTRGC